MKLFSAILEILEERNWEHLIDQDKQRIELEVIAANAGWTMNVFVIPDNYQAIFYSYYPLKCGKDQVDKLSLLLHKINLGLIIGNFEFDVEKREIRFKTNVDFSRSEIVFSQIEVALEQNIATSDKYFLAITKFFGTDQTMEEILNEIEAG